MFVSFGSFPSPRWFQVGHRATNGDQTLGDGGGREGYGVGVRVGVGGLARLLRKILLWVLHCDDGSARTG